MNRRPFHKHFRVGVKGGTIILLIALTVFLVFTGKGSDSPKASPENLEAGKNLGDSPKIVLGKLNIGKKVYVCGCPMMCCNSISETADEHCACNVPLQKGVVTKIRKGRITVNVSGREKIFLYREDVLLSGNPSH